MKLIKISQEKNSPQQIEIQQAQAVIQQGLANINKALETLESTNVSSLFNRTELINSIQSGLTEGIDPNAANQAIEAMTQITRTIPAINNAQKILENYGMDIREIKTTMVGAIQSNNWQDYQASIPQFNQNVSNLGNTQR